jgi:ribA/ribD-fused uncharacterized protein
MSAKDYRSYDITKAASFRKTTESFGGLSNMAGGYPIIVNGVKILTSEALYQACRYPDWPEVQKIIIGQHSPMTAKMISKREREKCRSDWDSVRVGIMKWCLRIKLIQNWDTFTELLESTGDMPIVEVSNKDPFWGCKVEEKKLVGVNALGRLLMELREYRRSKEGQLSDGINPPNIINFKMLGSEIGFLGKKNTTNFQSRLL